MKAALLIFPALFFAACDMDKMTGVKSEPTPTPRPIVTPKPTPKPGEWMWKDHKNPLDRPK